MVARWESACKVRSDLYLELWGIGRGGLLVGDDIVSLS